MTEAYNPRYSTKLPSAGTAASGGEDEYNRGTAMQITVGGASTGTTFSGTVAQALDKILYPFVAPSFSSFSFSHTSPLEVGDSIAAGSRTFTWGTNYSDNVATNSIDITDTTASTSLANDIANDSSESISLSAITKTSATSHTWTISGIDTQAGTFNRSFSISWQWRMYYGESTDPTATEVLVEALRVSGLGTSASGNKYFIGGGYKYIAYPVVFGLKTTFKDIATNLDVAMISAVTVNLTNSFGISQDYYVHRTLNILGGAITIAVS